MTEADFETLVSRVRNELGCSKELARDYATGIGEEPEIVMGQVLVRDENRRIIARLPMKVIE